MNMLAIVESWLKALSQAVPLEAFVFIGSFLEEMISPIPSTLIMGLAGSLAAADAKTLFYLVWLSLIGNAGKIIGSLFYYMLGDKAEDFAVKKIGRFFGVTHEQIEGIGRRFTGHWKDGLILFLLRLVPFFPTAPISIAAGVIKMPKRTFVIATFSGNFLKDFVYLFLGYTGIVALRSFFHTMIGLKYYVDIAIAISFAVLLFLLWYHRRRGAWFWQWCRGRCEGFFEKHKTKSTKNQKKSSTRSPKS